VNALFNGTKIPHKLIGWCSSSKKTWDEFSSSPDYFFTVSTFTVSNFLCTQVYKVEAVLEPESKIEQSVVCFFFFRFYQFRKTVFRKECSKRAKNCLGQRSEGMVLSRGF